MTHRPTRPAFFAAVLAAAVFSTAVSNVAIANPYGNPYGASTTAPLAVNAPGPAGFSSNNQLDVAQQSIVVMVDHLHRLSFDATVKKVLIGNPAIADVTMISLDEAVVTARTVGATNLFFIDETGRTIGDFEVVVREGERRRVVLRRGPGNTELYQCAPRCERTLSQIDSAENYTNQSQIVTQENDFANGAATAGAALDDSQ
ncbi:MAG: pilus assembly protein N-terminal domain-containing protein [Pseudomonadota bacterium]